MYQLYLKPITETSAMISLATKVTTCTFKIGVPCDYFQNLAPEAYLTHKICKISNTHRLVTVEHWIVFSWMSTITGQTMEWDF